MPKKERQQTVGELLELVGMGAFGNARAHRLSAGETQRVAIARALACFPEVILLDEPTANVDVENQMTIERIIREINKAKGISVVLTTHNMMQASRLAHETVFLYEGQLARSTYENILSGDIETDAGGRKCCALQNGLRLAVQSEKKGPVRIWIDPNAIEVSQAQTPGCPSNAFKGRLVQLTDEQSRVRGLVDIGVPLSVLMPKEDFRRLGLVIGDDVWLSCPVAKIKVF